VIVYLNGAFGVGKTTVAKLLIAELPAAVLFDPESVGTILSETLSRIDPKDDFQAYSSWTVLVDAFLRELRASYPHACIVVPMSLLNDEIREDVRRRMREIDRAFFAFTLIAQREELRRRILQRPLKETSREWCLQHIEYAPAISGLDDGSIVIDTTELTPQEVAASILVTLQR
jgi:2-phosphoglycerate kinase